MSELSDRLARLAGRGTPRGAADVFAAASADATSPASVTPLYRRATVATAIAATVALVAGVAGALTLDGDGDATPPARVARGSTTTQGAAAATTTPTTISEATKVYLASTRLIPFDHCGSLSSYAKTKALSVVGPYGLPGGGEFTTNLAIGDTAAAGPQRNAEESSPAPPVAAQTDEAYSNTNVQEAGIDEPDSVKTDGKTIFHVANNKVFATSTSASPELLGRIQIDGAQEMLRIADKLIVVSPGYGYYAARPSSSRGPQPVNGDARLSSMPYGGGSLQTRFTVVDISHPRNMKATGHLDVDGSYLSARLVDGVARIVVRSNPKMEFAYPTDGSPEAQAAATEHNKGVVRAATADTWLPHYTATDNRGREVASKPLVTCNSSYRPPGFSGFGMLSVLSFNTENPSFTRGTSVMANGEIVYSSTKRIYVATNSWGDVRGEDTPNPAIQPSPSTLIHAFDITDPVNATYRASGKVRGTVLNQFSMSEHRAALRVATTDPNGGSESFMTVLGDSGDALVPIGQVGGLGKGERIYAVRYIGDVGYVVTFRQVDPLYVIDLSDHTRPRVAGELHITGYSAYLHPLGDGLLLGVGQEATPEGRRAGLQLSIFDVRNPAAPKLVARKILGDGGSTAEFDHRAFLYWAATKLAVLPVYTQEKKCQDPSSPESCSYSTFNGAVGMRIGDASIDEVGRAEPPKAEAYGGVDRSVVVGNRLFLTTQIGVLVTALDNLSPTGWVAYPIDEKPQPGPPEPKPQP